MKKLYFLFFFFTITVVVQSQDKNSQYQVLAKDIFKELIEIN